MAAARREALLQELVAECPLGSGYLAGDLGERAFAERLVDKSVTRHGRIDVLVNNAAISASCPPHRCRRVPLDDRDLTESQFMVG